MSDDAEMTTPFIRVNNVRKVFRTNGREFLAISEATFDVAPGEYRDHNYVERDLLIGKALLIYWPHTWNRPIPFTPNFRRMGPIR